MWICDQGGITRQLETFWLHGDTIRMEVDGKPIPIPIYTGHDVEAVLVALKEALARDENFFDVNQPEYVP